MLPCLRCSQFDITTSHTQDEDKDDIRSRLTDSIIQQASSIPILESTSSGAEIIETVFIPPPATASIALQGPVHTEIPVVNNNNNNIDQRIGSDLPTIKNSEQPIIEGNEVDETNRTSSKETEQEKPETDEQKPSDVDRGEVSSSTNLESANTLPSEEEPLKGESELAGAVEADKPDLPEEEAKSTESLDPDQVVDSQLLSLDTLPKSFGTTTITTTIIETIGAQTQEEKISTGRKDGKKRPVVTLVEESYKSSEKTTSSAREQRCVPIDRLID